MNNLPAGRELDLLVAERVLGDMVARHTAMGPRPYSTDIAAAWEVVEKLREMVASVRAGSLVITPYAYPQVSGDEWCVMHNYDGYDGRHDARWRVSAKTAPHAICLAALQALGSEGRTA